MVYMDDSLLQFEATTEMPLPLPVSSSDHLERGLDHDTSAAGVDTDLCRFSSVSGGGRSVRKQGLTTLHEEEEEVVGASAGWRKERGGGRRGEEPVSSFYMSSDEDISESK